jgi:hypothetical protein
MKTKQQIESEIAKLQKSLKEIEAKEETEKNKVSTIEIDGWEYENKEHGFNETLSEIKILKGWELWTYEDCIKLHNNENFRKALNLGDCWFFIEQPFSFNKEKGFVARFYADSDRADLYCNGGPTVTNSSLGVRFKRKVKK